MQSCTFINVPYLKPVKLKNIEICCIELEEGISYSCTVFNFLSVMMTNKRTRKQLKSTACDQKIQNKSECSEQESIFSLFVILNFKLPIIIMKCGLTIVIKRAQTNCREHLNLLSVKINTGKICFADGLRYS